MFKVLKVLKRAWRCCHRFTHWWALKIYLSLKRDRTKVSETTLYYGPDIGAKLTRNADLTGGLVKLHYLNGVFPHSVNSNVCYFVSSALPRHAVRLAKWAQKHGLKVIVNQNGIAYPAWTRDYLTINSELEELLSLCDLVVYQSAFCKRGVEEFLNAKLTKWDVIFNCVNTDQFAPAYTERSDELRLLVAGTHYQRERVTQALYATRWLIDKGINARLTIAGQLSWGGAQADVFALISECGLIDNVEIIGTYAHRHAPRLYNKNDILLHLKYKDPCPNVVIEAMACGLPVVGSASGGMDELVGDSCGKLISVEDSWSDMFYPSVIEIGEAVVSLAESLSEQKLATRERALRNFSVENWLHRHSNLLQELVLQ